MHVFDSWAALAWKQDLKPITDQDTIPYTPNDAGVQPFEANKKPDKDTVHTQVLQDAIKSLTKRKISACIGNTAYIERGLELKHQVSQLSVNSDDGNDQVQIMGSIPIESSSGFITSTLFFGKQDGDTYTLLKAKCTCPIGNWGNCKHCAAVMLYALDRQQQQTEAEEPSPLPSSPVLTKRSFDASSEGDNDSSSNESRKKANSSVESYDSVSWHKQLLFICLANATTL